MPSMLLTAGDRVGPSLARELLIEIPGRYITWASWTTRRKGRNMEAFPYQVYRQFLGGKSAEELSRDLDIPVERIRLRLEVAAALIERARERRTVAAQAGSGCLAELPSMEASDDAAVASGGQLSGEQ
jgi:hypothetical protein